MMKKLAWFAFLTLVVGGVAVFYFISDGISPANCAKIKEGMKIVQVDAILGTLGSVGPMQETDPPRLYACWFGTWGDITVELDADKQDELAGPASYAPHSRSLLAKFRKWLGW
jgi:hypothetical protein